jgi:hypothetical protein
MGNTNVALFFFFYCLCDFRKLQLRSFSTSAFCLLVSFWCPFILFVLLFLFFSHLYRLCSCAPLPLCTLSFLGFSQNFRCYRVHWHLTSRLARDDDQRVRITTLFFGGHEPERVGYVLAGWIDDFNHGLPRFWKHSTLQASVLATDCLWLFVLRLVFLLGFWATVRLVHSVSLVLV